MNEVFAKYLDYAKKVFEVDGADGVREVIEEMMDEIDNIFGADSTAAEDAAEEMEAYFGI